MQLSKPELEILEQIANGNKSIKQIALALKKSNKQIYSITRKLVKKRLVQRIRGIIEPIRTAHLSLLLQQLSKLRNLPKLLANSGIPIFKQLLNPKEMKSLIKLTGFKKSIIYKKLKEARNRSLVIKTDSKFQLNKRLNILVDFLAELERFESTTDQRVPLGSIIYHKNKKEILFSSKEELNATKTFFSAYKNFGISLLTITNHYYLPKKKLTKEDVLKHSLLILEKEPTISNLILFALFYAKFRKSFRIKHEVLINLNKVFNGEEIKNYPSLDEIKDRLEVYNIKL